MLAPLAATRPLTSSLEAAGFVLTAHPFTDLVRVSKNSCRPETLSTDSAKDDSSIRRGSAGSSSTSSGVDLSVML